MAAPLDRRTWRRRGDVAHVSTSERAALLDLRHLERPPYLLHGSGALVWQLLEDRLPTADLVAAVADHYEMPQDGVTHSVVDFLDQLLDLGVVEVDA